MKNHPYVDRYQDLIAYKKARQLTREIFAVSKQFPREERFSLTDQIRRSSRSVGAQIAEAWAKRRYRRHFISKLTDADAEQLETQHWIETAKDCSYIREQQAAELLNSCQETGRLIGNMIAKAHLFAQRPPRSLREEGGIYVLATLAAKRSEAVTQWVDLPLCLYSLAFGPIHSVNQ